MILWAQGKSGSALPHPWPWFLVEGQGHIRCPVPSFAAFTTSPNFTKWLYANVLLWPMRSSRIFVHMLFKRKAVSGTEWIWTSELWTQPGKKARPTLGTPTEVLKPVLFTTYRNRSQTWGNLREETIDFILPVWSVNSPKKKLPMCLCKKELLAPILDNALSTFGHFNSGHPFRFNLQIIGMKDDESLQMPRLQNRSNRFKQKHLWICKRNSFEMNLDLHLSKCYAAMHICCHCPFSDVAKSRCVQTPCSNPPGGRELGTAMGE